MSDETVNKAEVYPRPVMSETELLAWNSLSRDQQVERTKDVLEQAGNSGLSDRTMAEIRLSARSKLAESE